LLQRDEGELASADGAAAHEAAETLLAQHTRPVTSPLGGGGGGATSGHATRDRDKRLVVVANRLPVTLNKGADGAYTFKMSSGGLVSALVSVRSKVDFIWIGWLGKEVPPADQAGVRKRLIDEFQCCPVFLSDALAGPYYNTMANAEVSPAPPPPPSLSPTPTLRVCAPAAVAALPLRD
jgi:trehalose 6-phosphate synthase